MSDPKGRTIFERVWEDNPEEHLFKSERHQVMAAVDISPRLPLQVVIAPRKGDYGKEAHFSLLPFEVQQKMLLVARAVGKKILVKLDPDQKVLYNISGFRVRDHAHIVLAAAREGDLSVLQDGPDLGKEAVERTKEALAFERWDEATLEGQLSNL